MYKRLKLGGHVYYRTSVKIAVVTWAALSRA
jgi:hypothetical protein